MKQARFTGGSIENPIFSPEQSHLRWSEFKNTSPEVMHATIADDVFPFLRALGTQLGGDGSTYSEHMKLSR